VVAVVAELMVAEIELGSLCAKDGSHSTSLEMRLLKAEIELGSLCARNGSHSTSLEMRILKEQNDGIETEEKAHFL